MRFLRDRSSKQKRTPAHCTTTFEPLEGRRLLTVAVWTGAGGDGLFTNAANWQGNVAPTAGQAIDFPASAASTNVIINANVTVGVTEIDASYNISATNGSAITLDGSLTTTVGDANISAPIVLGATEVFEANDAALMDITGGISDGGNNLGIVKTGNGEVELAGTAETYTGETTGEGGILIDTTPLAGPIGIHAGTTFYGSSSISTINGFDGSFAPETFNVTNSTTAPATLTVSDGINFTSPSGATLNFDIGGPTDSSQIVVSGGTIDLADGTFNAAIVNGYTPASGDVITLIQNNTGQPISGTFDGLAQGATVAIGGTDYTISYTGGSNHENVTLTAPGTPSGITISSYTTETSTHGFTAGASVVATDNAAGGTAGLTYTWTCTHVPSGGKLPTFNVNGTNAASSVIARFSKDGTYVLQCTVTDKSGNTKVVSLLAIVSQKATSIKIEPHGAKVAPHATQQFTATILDQFGHPMRTTQVIDYALSKADGTISDTGLFTAGTTKGALDVDVTSDTLSAYVGVTVT